MNARVLFRMRGDSFFSNLYREFETRIEELNQKNRGRRKIQYGDKKRALERAMRMWIDSGEG